jgi:hypothetical protein
MQPMKLKLFALGLVALIQIACSDTENGNTSGGPQSAAEGQDEGVMPIQNGLSNRPIGESTR